MYVQTHKINNSYTTYVVQECLKSKTSHGGLASKSSNKSYRKNFQKRHCCLRLIIVRL